MTLRDCRDCGSDDVEICSGDAVVCNACGHMEPFDEWNRNREDVRYANDETGKLDDSEDED